MYHTSENLAPQNKKMEGNSLELVFIPFPSRSHLVALMQLAKLLIAKSQRLSITVVTFELPTDTKTDSFLESSIYPRTNFVRIPFDEPSWEFVQKSHRQFLVPYMENRKRSVRDAVAAIVEDPFKILAGFVLDMFSTPMIDLAEEFRVPSYIFFTSGAASLGLMLHFQSLSDENVETHYEDLDAAFKVPTYANPVPVRVLPSPILENEIQFFDHMRSYRRCKGIVVNSFLELETHAVQSLLADENVPKVYPVGPIIHNAAGEELGAENQKEHEDILRWLDHQPDSSVLFICFGTAGTLPNDQVKEIARALESSGYRFIWSLRKPPSKEKFEIAGDYDDLDLVLPEGFLKRTDKIGKVIGWAPQVAVLSHSSVGGFVSHAGWNSSLESTWWAVPMAVWPLCREQQLNAFQFVQEFGMAVDIKMDYRVNSGVMVGADKIEQALRELMDTENDIRVKVKAMRDMSRMAHKENGSSHDFLGRLVEDIIRAVSSSYVGF